MVTCWSRHSRNRRAGELIAQGRSAEGAIQEIGMVVEGITTAPVLRDIGRRVGVDLPITDAVCAVLEGGDPHEIGPRLMRRRPKAE
jgi:glycerol-3-phosphate dehydrogenase (NAD(P)+)